MKRDLIEIKIPNKPDYVGVIRLTTSSIASNMGLNIEEIEDVKVSIAEACINALGRSENFIIKYEIYDDRLVIFVEDVREICSKDDSKEKELGVFIIKSLMDEVHFIDNGIKMIKIIEDGIDD